MQSGTLNDTSLVGDGGGVGNLSHVHSRAHSVTHVPSGRRGRRGGSVASKHWGTIGDTSLVEDGGLEEDLSHVGVGGRSVRYVPSGGWGRSSSVPCTEWGTLSQICT